MEGGALYVCGYTEGVELDPRIRHAWGRGLTEAQAAAALAPGDALTASLLYVEVCDTYRVLGCIFDSIMSGSVSWSTVSLFPATLSSIAEEHVFQLDPAVLRALLGKTLNPRQRKELEDLDIELGLPARLRQFDLLRKILQELEEDDFALPVCSTLRAKYGLSHPVAWGLTCIVFLFYTRMNVSDARRRLAHLSADALLGVANCFLWSFTLVGAVEGPHFLEEGEKAGEGLSRSSSSSSGSEGAAAAATAPLFAVGLTDNVYDRFVRLGQAVSGKGGAAGSTEGGGGEAGSSAGVPRPPVPSPAMTPASSVLQTPDAAASALRRSSSATSGVGLTLDVSTTSQGGGGSGARPPVPSPPRLRPLLSLSRSSDTIRLSGLPLADAAAAGALPASGLSTPLPPPFLPGFYSASNGGEPQRASGQGHHQHARTAPAPLLGGSSSGLSSASTPGSAVAGGGGGHSALHHARHTTAAPALGSSSSEPSALSLRLGGALNAALPSRTASAFEPSAVGFPYDPSLLTPLADVVNRLLRGRNERAAVEARALALFSDALRRGRPSAGKAPRPAGVELGLPPAPALDHDAALLRRLESKLLTQLIKTLRGIAANVGSPESRDFIEDVATGVLDALIEEGGFTRAEVALLLVCVGQAVPSLPAVTAAPPHLRDAWSQAWRRFMAVVWAVAVIVSEADEKLEKLAGGVGGSAETAGGVAPHIWVD